MGKCNTKLSVNINKIALLRNSRGANIPDVIQFAKDCERFGADGITVHPRPDERHITRADVYQLKDVVRTEFNIEGYPSPDFLKMVLEVKPHQCTLVPDEPEQLTSDHGWDTEKHESFLAEVISELQKNNIRVSIFIGPEQKMLDGAAKVKTDRIEFFTGPYAHEFYTNKDFAIKDFRHAGIYASELGLGINAGHDLNLDNLKFFKENIPDLLEVSIGHALVRDCLYFGLQNVIPMYKRNLA
jgi:pyridoxine 5-phosphate synthase